MTSTKAASGGAEGYWTIEVVNKDQSRGGQYLCHAYDDRDARRIAGHLAGAAQGGLGYDYHRVDNPTGRYAQVLELGQSKAVEDADAWAVLRAARRSA